MGFSLFLLKLFLDKNQQVNEITVHYIWLFTDYNLHQVKTLLGTKTGSTYVRLTTDEVDKKFQIEYDLLASFWSR